jgi:alpha-1,2-mannosyltransferase
MPAEARSRVLIAAIVGACFGLYGWAVFAMSFRHDGVIAPPYNAPGIDFMVYWEAARAALAGRLDLLFDGDRFTAALNEDFRPWLTAPLPFHPWVYPPHFLLLTLPFGLAPFALGYALFAALSFAALAAALLAGERGYRRPILAGALLLSPAASINVIAGQNGFLTGALLIGGFRLLAAWPALAGALLGILTVKPQLCLMVPVALAAARQGRALAGACLTALALGAASAAIFGIETWRQWFAPMLDPANPIHRGWTALSLRWGESVYSCALQLGASPGAAAAAQAVAIAAAAASVAWAYSRPAAPGDHRLAVLLAATILAAPHVASYDMVLLAIAAALLFCQAIERGFRRFDLALAVTVWLAPLYAPPAATVTGITTPLVLILFIVAQVSPASKTAAPSTG